MLDIAEPRLRRLYDYWTQKRRDGRLPGRADIDPIEMSFVLGDLMLVDVLDGDPPGFRFRLHGSNLARRAGYELTGRLFDDLPQTEFRRLVREAWTDVVATGQPIRYGRDLILDGRRHHFESLVLPLASDGARVDMLVAAVIYRDAHRSAAA